jgi:hypothetical protein
MYYDDHPPPHVHVECQGQRAKLDFQGRVLAGRLSSRTALHRIREWMELHPCELMRNRELAEQGKPLEQIAPLE